MGAIGFPFIRARIRGRAWNDIRGRYAFHLGEKKRRISWPENEIPPLAVLEGACYMCSLTRHAFPWWRLTRSPGFLGPTAGPPDSVHLARLG